MQKDEYAKAFGEHLKSLLEEKGMTQRQFAKKAGLKESETSRWVNGGRYPSLRNAKKISDILGVSIDELVNWVENDD